MKRVFLLQTGTNRATHWLQVSKVKLAVAQTRRPDTQYRDVRRQNCVDRISRGRQLRRAPRIRDELIYAGLHYRSAPRQDLLNLFRIEVDTDDRVYLGCETRRRYRTNIAQSKDADPARH